MSSKQVLWGLVPWLLYAVATTPDRERAGIVAAAAAASWALAAICRALIGSQRPKVLDVCALGVFGAFTVIELVGDAATRSALDDQGRGCAAAILAAVMLISAAVRPFTEEYTSATVPQSYRASPVFRSVHRDLSIRWGCAIAIVAIGYLVEADVSAVQGSELGAFALTFLVPLLAVVVASRQSTVSGLDRRAAAGDPRSGPSTKSFRSGTP